MKGGMYVLLKLILYYMYSVCVCVRTGHRTYSYQTDPFWDCPVP